jgi:cytochrome c oxidase cbb3-type subunit IV
MNLYSIISIAATVLTFLAFLGIVGWAFSRRRAAAFEEAANAPFALPDDGERTPATGHLTGQQP